MAAQTVKRSRCRPAIFKGVHKNGGIITSSAEHKVDGLQDYRPIGSFTFLGRYRVIDFPISNLSNSGIINQQVYIASKARSMIAHIGTGRHYNINSKRGRLQLLPPTEEKVNDIYNTNIRAMYENLEYIKRQSQEYVVIAPSCMVFKQDYDALLQGHAASGADITALYHTVHHAKSGYETCHIFDIADDKVNAIRRNLGDEDVRAISMESFVMKKSLLIKLIGEARAISSMFNLSDVINAKIGDLDVRAVEHFGYFGPITSLKSYYDANAQLLNPEKAAELFTPDWPIYTRTNDSCPSQYYDEAEVKNSLISVVGRGVVIGKGSVIKGCYISAYTTIGDNVHLEYQIVDKYVTIDHENCIIADKENPGYVKYMDKL